MWVSGVLHETWDAPIPLPRALAATSKHRCGKARRLGSAVTLWGQTRLGQRLDHGGDARTCKRVTVHKLNGRGGPGTGRGGRGVSCGKQESRLIIPRKG